MAFTENQAWDYFFYFGKSPLEDEVEYELYQLLLEPKRNLYYNRRESAGVSEYAGRPNDIEIQVFLRFEIANAIAYRNTIVVDGSNNQKDRRIAASQNSISFIPSENNLEIGILYFLYANYEQPKTTNFPLIK